MGLAARVLVDAAELGSVRREDAHALAHEWLSLTGGDLANAVLASSDEHVASRLVELATHVIRVIDGGQAGASSGLERREGAR